MSPAYDIIIVGGGIMGSSAAYHLLSLEPNLALAIVEKDPLYTHASTPLSLGGIRIQFTLKENILISLYAQEAYSRFEEEMAVEGEKPFINYRKEGYLFLIEETGRAAAEAALTFQRQMGGEVEWWTPEKIQARYPILSMDGFCGGTFGLRDGYLDPYAVLMGYRAKAKSLGAEFRTDTVTEMLRSQSSIEGVRLQSGAELKAGAVVNAAGAWAGAVARTAGVDLPVVPIKRQVFAFKPAIPVSESLPLVIYPSDLYFRPETGGVILTGKSLKEDPITFDLSWQKERFEEIIWPELARFVPSFESLKLIRGWAGLYETNLLDHNAIIGPWPELEGLFLINGFSGHGVQQAPAAGRYLAELILHRTPALQLSCFSPRRILENRPLLEIGVV
jgi:FAD-dependent oxidoreductase domain-containing protein 1